MAAKHDPHPDSSRPSASLVPLVKLLGRDLLLEDPLDVSIQVDGDAAFPPIRIDPVRRVA